MAVASNSPRRNVDRMLQTTGLTGYLYAVVTVDEITKPKPDPQIFLKAAEKLSVKPSDSVVVEDSVHGIAAGRAAMMRTVAVLTGGASRQDLLNAGSDMLVDSLKEVDASAVRRLLGR